MRTPLTRLLLLAVVAHLAPACSKATLAAEDAAGPPAASGGALGHLSSNPIEAALCGGRPGCRLESDLWQSDTSQGSRAVVAVVHQPNGPARPERSAFRYGMEPAKAEAPSLCAPWETWLTSVASNQAKRVQLLVADCPSGVRAPVIADLGPNRIRYTLDDHGGASHEYDIGLEPLRVDRETHRGRGGELSWSYTNYGGQHCDQGECVPVMLEAAVTGDAFSREGWKTTGLGECSMLVDGVTGDGSSHGRWVAHGASSSVRLLISAGTLYAEVTDDAFVTKGPVVDTLVFYSTSREARPGDRSATARLRMDGQLTDWQGNVRQVETAIGSSTRRFALPEVWPGPEDLWRLSYEDTDDGRTLGPGQSTGQVSHEPWVFVSPFPCIAHDGALRVDRTTVSDAEKPLVP